MGLTRTAAGGSLPAALLLDLDGTLVDSEPVHREGFRRFFAARGWECTDATLALFTGRRADDVFASTPGPWAGLDPAELFHEVVAATPLDLAPTPVPGARELLDACDAASVPYVLVTSADAAWARRALEPLGGIGRFHGVVTRADVEQGKPAPDGYLRGAQLADAAPGRCLAAEDTPAGVAAAGAAGVGEVVGITTSFAVDDLMAAGASRTAPDLRHLT